MTSQQFRLQEAQAIIGKMDPEEMSQALEEAMDKSVSLEELVLRSMVQGRLEAPSKPVLRRDDAVWE